METQNNQSPKKTPKQLRGFVFTWNNYDDAAVAAVRGFAERCKYLVFGYEVAESGTPHLQGYAQLKKRTAFLTIKKALPGAHIEQAYGTPTQAANYCKKDGNFEELGEMDHPKDAADGAADGEKGGEKEKERWREMIDWAKRGKFAELELNYPREYAMHYLTWKQLAKDYMVRVPDIEWTTGLWIYGPSGVGKSRGIRTVCNDVLHTAFYPKMANKWWDGYQHEEVVVLDDLDKTHACLAHHLKLWGDHYGFVAENKGGAFYARPKIFVVTSQYSIDQIWEDVETREALHRRYDTLHLDTLAHALKWKEDCLSQKKIIFSNDA